MAIVGTAEVLVTANAKGLEESLKAQSDPALQGFTKDAELAGEDAGAGLGTGLQTGTKNMEKDLAKKGEEGGKGLSSGLKSALGGLGVPEALLSGWGALGVAAIGVGVATFMMGNKMQETDAKIANTEGISTKAATKIGDAFLGTAMKSEFSGQQMAAAFAPVSGQLKSITGQALTTKQSLDVMTAASDLASASGGDLAGTTQSLAAVMQAFKIQPKDAAAATDVLYNAANQTGQSVGTVAEAIGKMKSRLGEASPPLAELAANMIDLQDNGLKGRMAVTGLNGIMNGLQAAATGSTAAGKLSAQTLAAYGLSAQQANGQLTPMSTLIAGLGPKFAIMNAVQQTAAATQLVGAAGAKALVAAVDGGSAVYDRATKATEKHGTVTAAAARNAQTMHGATKTLMSGLSDLGTKIGEAVVPLVTRLELGFSKVVQAVVKDWPTISKVIDTVIHMVTPMIQGMILVFKGMMTTIQGLVEFVVNIFQGKWGKAWNDILKILKGVWQMIQGVFKEAFGNILQLVGGALDKVWGFFAKLPGRLVSALGDLVGTIWGGLLASASWIDTNVISPVVNLFTSLPGRLLSGLGNIVGTVFGGLSGAWGWIKTNVFDPVVSGFTGLPGAIGDAIGSAIGDIGAVGKDIINALISGIDDAISWYNNNRPSAFGISLLPALPTIPHLATGGIVHAQPGGVLALLGEAGVDEAVVPMNQVGKRGAASGSSLAARDVHINLYGTNMTAAEGIAEMSWALKTGAFTTKAAVA